jgi:hypothetical protein
MSLSDSSWPPLSEVQVVLTRMYVPGVTFGCHHKIDAHPELPTAASSRGLSPLGATLLEIAKVAVLFPFALADQARLSGPVHGHWPNARKGHANHNHTLPTCIAGSECLVLHNFQLNGALFCRRNHRRPALKLPYRRSFRKTAPTWACANPATTSRIRHSIFCLVGLHLREFPTQVRPSPTWANSAPSYTTPALRRSSMNCAWPPAAG